MTENGTRATSCLIQLDNCVYLCHSTVAKYLPLLSIAMFVIFLVPGRGRGRARGAARPRRRPLPDTRNWLPPQMQQPVIPPFTGVPGIQFGSAGFEKLDFVSLFLTDELIDMFVTETNLYAQQKINIGPQRRCVRLHQWYPTDRVEMKKFIGLTLLMGIVHKPDIAMYWSTDPLYRSAVFPAVMGRNRYQLLLSLFHFNDNNAMPDRNDVNRDRLYKIRPLLTYLLHKFETVYTPSQCVAVDETLLLWKGKLHFRQYIPMKRARFGVKVFNLCESDMHNGYTYRFHVYTGSMDPVQNIVNALPAECINFDRAAQEVVHLLQPLLDNGYWVFTDNYYTSIELYSYLYTRQTLACGTLKHYRAPIALQTVDMEVGETIAVRADELLAQKYADKKYVYMLSTIHDESIRTVRRRDQDVQKPESILLYNSKMGSVDSQEQKIQPYAAARKTMKWYRKVAFHFMQVSILNAYILFQKTGGTGSFLDFEHDIICQLIFPVTDPTLANDDVNRLVGRHFPASLPVSQNGRQSYKNCRVCTKRGIRKQTSVHCPDCPSNPGLCMDICYKDYHTKVDYGH